MYTCYREIQSVEGANFFFVAFCLHLFVSDMSNDFVPRFLPHILLCTVGPLR